LHNSFLFWLISLSCSRNSSSTPAHVGEELRFLLLLAQVIRGYWQIGTSFISQHGLLPLEEDDKIATVLNHLLGCSWLYRVWIFRELVLSRDPTIQYSDIRFPWGTLCNVASSMANTLQYMRLEAVGHNSILLSSYLNRSRQVELNLCQKINVVIRMNWVKWNARSLIEKRQCSNSPNILPEDHPENSQN
jgi:hypothetical protein